MRQSFVFFATLSLCGCGGGSGTSSTTTSTPTAAAVQAAEVVGVVRDAPPGSAVVLLADAEGPDLMSQSAAFLDARELGPDGAFRLPRPASATRVWVLAPGRAVVAAPLPADDDGAWVLDPPIESTWTVRVRDDAGEPEEDALLLVLDAQGAPLPLPAPGLVADAAGRLVARGLPPGRYVGLFQSGDARRHARRTFEVGLGEAHEADVVLRADESLALRWLRVCGGDAAELARQLAARGAE